MEVTKDDLDKAEQGLLQLQEQERQITRMVARQEGIVLYLRQRLEEGQNGDEQKNAGTGLDLNQNTRETPQT